MNGAGETGGSAPAVVLITGASSGIGRATAAQLAALGFQIVVGYHSRREAAEAVVRALPGQGHVALRVAIDDAASVSAAARLVEDRYGRLDALVNNGGATHPVPANDLDALTDELFDRIVSLNLRGPFAMVRSRSRRS